MNNLEIHIKDGQCKVIEGLGRRVFRTTEEALGLALLRLNPAAAGNIDLAWMDFLADRGVAMALSGDRVLALLKYPSRLLCHVPAVALGGVVQGSEVDQVPVVGDQGRDGDTSEHDQYG